MSFLRVSSAYAAGISVAVMVLISAQIAAQTGQQQQQGQGNVQQEKTGGDQQQPPVMDAAKMKSEASYLIGRNIAKNFKDSGIELDMEMMLKGMKEVFAGTESSISEEDEMKTMNAFQKYMQKQSEKKFAELADKNKREGEAFLTANKNKEGVVQTESGLQYKVVKQGTGPVPKATDAVKVFYKGTFIDGEEFDSSAKYGKDPSSFQIGQLTKGFAEGLMRMPVGSKYLLYIPAELAYGMGGQGMEPNKVLIFELELVEIIK